MDGWGSPLDASTALAWQTVTRKGHRPPASPARKKLVPMCSPVRCRTCGKITWSGCGDHVDQVRALVPDELWCPGHEDEEPVARGWFSGRR